MIFSGISRRFRRVNSQTIKLNVHYFLTPPYPQNYFHFLHSDHPQHDENHVQGAGRLNTERSWTHNEGSFTVTGISNILMRKKEKNTTFPCYEFFCLFSDALVLQFLSLVHVGV